MFPEYSYMVQRKILKYSTTDIASMKERLKKLVYSLFDNFLNFSHLLSPKN